MLGPTKAQIIFAWINSISFIIWNYTIIHAYKKNENQKIIKN